MLAFFTTRTPPPASASNRLRRSTAIAFRVSTVPAVSAAVITLVASLCVIVAPDTHAQERRVASPTGQSATEIGAIFDERLGHVGGQWIDIRYGRPIKRGRNLFGLSDSAEALNDGAPVWRAGANVSTQLTAELPIVIGDTTVAPGTYTVFIDLKQEPWTFILSNWPAQVGYDYENTDALFGAFDYTADRDVVRTPMTRETLPWSLDQLAWQFLDVTDRGGHLAVMWDREMASIAFAVGPSTTP